MVILTLTNPAWAHGDTSHGESTHKQPDTLHHDPEVSAVESADGIHGHAHTHVREAECLMTFAMIECVTDLGTHLSVATQENTHDRAKQNIQRLSAVHRHMTHVKSRIGL